MRRLRFGLVPVALALAVGAAWRGVEDGHPTEGVLDGIVGALIVLAGLVAWDRVGASRTGPLMVLAGTTWFAGTWFPIAVFWHRGPLVHLQLSYPTGRLRRRAAMVAVAVAYVDALVEPIARNDVVTLMLAALVSAAAFDVFARSSGRARRADTPALGAALSYSGMLAVGASARLLGLQADNAILIAYDIVVVAVVVVLLIDLLWGRWTESVVADLVVSLGEHGGLGTLRDQLARALGDPSLIVGYWVIDQERYVDDFGRPIDLARAKEGKSVTSIEDGGQRIAVLVQDPTSIDDPRLVASVAAATRLAVVNARLQADARARLIELNVSRRRVVESGDEQRRRLERELAAGADPKLDRVLILVESARREAPDPHASELAALGDELRGARDELHDISVGIRPPALESGGLAAALPLLAARSPVPIRLSVDVGRMAPVVEATMYFVCAEALANVVKHAQASAASVTIAVSGVAVVVSILDDGVGGVDPARGTGLRGLADRVEALGGLFSVVDGSSRGTAITAEIPLAEGHLGVRR
jgi:signal transduction histidine kinase